MRTARPEIELVCVISPRLQFASEIVLAHAYQEAVMLHVAPLANRSFPPLNTPPRRYVCPDESAGGGAALVGMNACSDDALRSRLERALASGDARLERLSRAETSVTFFIGEGSVTLLLDRSPPILARAEEPAEITIELGDEQADLFGRGLLSISSLLITGQARYRGPVRKYLAVDPVLRGLLAELYVEHDDEA